jgi:hypothetical protein
VVLSLRRTIGPALAGLDSFAYCVVAVGPLDLLTSCSAAAIAAGADASVSAEDGTTAMALAADNDNPEVVVILAQACARG